MEFTVKNERSAEIEVELAGWLENAVCLHSAQTREGLRCNRLVRREGLLFLECSAQEAAAKPGQARPDIVFEDFEGETYSNWSVMGTAFGAGPVEMVKIPTYQGDVGGKGKRVVNSHASAPGKSVEKKDSATGTLTSRPFTIDRYYITFLIGGGAHKGKTCMNLLVEGNPVLSATGQNDNRMRPMSWDVRRWAGKTATMQIVDQEPGGWGNIGVDDILFSDSPREPLGPLADEGDFGTLGLGLIESKVQSPKSKVQSRGLGLRLRRCTRWPRVGPVLREPVRVGRR
jgi:non-lysosomal glucosylceramidase